MPFRLVLPRPLCEAMLAQAVQELPNECCGLLAGRVEPGAEDGPVGRVAARYPLTNAAASEREYLSEPKDMFHAVRDMRKHGYEILAVYHSHPTSDPIPSRTDLERNYSPQVVNFIISLKDDIPLLRGWWLKETGYEEAEWQISP